jgi:hypothetical protein
MHRTFPPLFALLALAAPVVAADALWHVEFTDEDGQPKQVDGRILIEAQDGGLLVEGRDGALQAITAAHKPRAANTGMEFAPLSAEELGERLRQDLAGFGEGFMVTRTEHYVICSDAGDEFAGGVGKLFERLYDAYRAHFQRTDLDLDEPRFPLPAIVFADRKDFARFALTDNGPATAQSQGYYSIRTNRIVLYDLSGRPGTDAGRRLTALRASAATVIHEATHQIAYNTGLHTRYADNPLWLTEGFAMAFETLDPNDRSLTRSIGRPHPTRLRQFLDYARNRRKPGSLGTLVTTDARLGDPETAKDAYAEAWALTYFLSRTQPDAYARYLETIGNKPRLSWDSPEQRAKEFEAAFGKIEQIEPEFLRSMSRVRLR